MHTTLWPPLLIDQPILAISKAKKDKLPGTDPCHLFCTSWGDIYTYRILHLLVYMLYFQAFSRYLYLSTIYAASRLTLSPFCVSVHLFCFVDLIWKAFFDGVDTLL